MKEDIANMKIDICSANYSNFLFSEGIYVYQYFGQHAENVDYSLRSKSCFGSCNSDSVKEVNIIPSELSERGTSSIKHHEVDVDRELSINSSDIRIAIAYFYG